MKKIENIKKYMSDASINQKKLAEKTGIAQATLSKILSGKYPINHKHLVEIAKGLDVSVDDIIEESSQSINTIVEGYIEYDGEIIKIKTYTQFKKIADRIEYETKILPKEVREIKELNKKNKENIKKTRSNANYDFNIDDFSLVQSHDATNVDCWAFKTASDTKDGVVIDFGNQCEGYPFEFHGEVFNTSESAYLCGQFSNNSEEHKRIQYQLLSEKNGYTAKKRIKNPNAHLMREDWSELSAEWMLYVIWHKCKGNNAFAEKLKSLPIDAVIIENSTTIHEGTSVYWGCKNDELEEARNKVQRYAELQYSKKARREKKKDLPNLDVMIQQARDEIQYIGTYSGGCNYMGKILKRCQIALLNNTEPNINYNLFKEKKIYLFGKLLEF